MSENKTGKYIKYAIGEIVLVVIGILIALQINNWNESRKKIQLEISILKDIKSDLKDNISNLTEGIKHTKSSLSNNTKIIEFYENKTPFNDSLLVYFSNFSGYWDPDFTYAGFENLKSIGVNLISSTPLRREIINLIEVEMDILDNSDMSSMNQINTTLFLPLAKKYLRRNITLNQEYLPYVPTDYETMMQDEEFYNVCTEIGYRQLRSYKRFENFNKKANNLISKIDQEIEKLEK
ncbi:DUF6090 family protein [Hanstruepera ponticola]|uniref:DUF6090 family protein n=1 Tax=Hanstruepera ponticola TaxID=2042995 RepID=UPI0013C4BDC1|nr:DUF6090 family protein [Hanstruepera ponticola]